MAAGYSNWSFDGTKPNGHDEKLSNDSKLAPPTIAPCFMTATQALAYYKADLLTVEQMAQSTLDRIKERDSQVLAWSYLNPELILANARALDALPKEKRGPLHGIPIGVKDVIYTKDMPTGQGSHMYFNDMVKADAGPVMSLRAAGALIFGKTTTVEFAAGIRGYPTKSPFDPERTPGGSSMGSGAAVGDYQCTLGLGTQTGGSTIRPGSYNNIYAMKPTWTSISREGLKLLSISLDTLGLMARSAEDLELMCSVFQLKDDVEPVSKPINELKIGFAKTPVWDMGFAGPDLIATWAKAKELLTEAGATVTDIELDTAEFGPLPKISRTIMFTEARSAFLGDYLRAPVSLHSEFAGHVENKEGYTRADQLQAYDHAAKMRPIIDSIASEYDAILTPSTPAGSTLGIDTTGQPQFCGMWTTLHVPVINVPGFADSNGMPMGLSIVSGRYRDMNLVKVAQTLGKVFAGADEGRMKKLPGVPSL